MSSSPSGYCGRFAPTPSGPLHAGSLVAALASWLDARAHHGTWLLRLEDVDRPRCVPGADRLIVQQLATCGLLPDQPPTWQSDHEARYAAALHALAERGWAYPCHCSRSRIEAAQAAAGLLRQRHAPLVYPGTCRPERLAGGAQGLQGPEPLGAACALGSHANPSTPSSPNTPAWRLHVGRVQQALGLPEIAHWHDRRLGAQQQALAHEVGDFVLRRADGLWAYQLAVVADDAAQGITHVVRGADLADNTARQLLLQAALGLPTPHYLHAPLVLGADGSKLSKQNGAAALDLHHPLTALNQAATVLGLPAHAGPLPQALADWTGHWARFWEKKTVGCPLTATIQSVGANVAQRMD
ncbi:tRNA glutamyl-Q(34) synthetase GluQRS [Serpentinimonas barnesii]|uniref:tRNA glutamyl-Q(34) synthetase GluQRS n=1 Tax=Serpentinimonas barnesii TaxID=1458427 RepID=UPI0009716BE0|nr:tRNA glutamyl-Q(34) synthetase GluQRS [Serpentinimonas barnesii]